MYIVVCFLLLWTLFQLILCEAIYCNDENLDPKGLYLLETDDPTHKEINNWFLDNYPKDVYTQYNIKVLENCSSKFKDFIKDIKKLAYVIHLYVTDFYQHNYNEVIRKNFSWAGDINLQQQPQSVCRFDTNKTYTTEETCQPYKSMQQQTVKLVSAEVMSISFLYNLVSNIRFRPQLIPQELPYKEVYYCIILCRTKDVSYVKNLSFDDAIIRIETYRTNDCNEFKENVIAVIAPNPSVIEETHKPVIFYEEPYELPVDTAFYNNSIIRLRSRQTLSKAFLLFMIKVNWNRVAVLSDDAIESVAFEDVLRKEFSDASISFIVLTVRETKKGYNFSEALTTLKKADARIIIANVNKGNAIPLAEQTKLHRMSSSQVVLWLAHNWPEATAKAAAKIMGTVFTFAEIQTTVTTYLHAISSVINKNIHNASYAYLNHTQFANDIRKSLGEIRETSVSVIENKSNGHSKPIASCKNGKCFLYKSFPPIPFDRRRDCIVPSSNYYKACDDIVLIYFMLVVVAISVSVLGITFFFQTPDTPYNRMAN